MRERCKKFETLSSFRQFDHRFVSSRRVKECYASRTARHAASRPSCRARANPISSAFTERQRGCPVSSSPAKPVATTPPDKGAPAVRGCTESIP